MKHENLLRSWKEIAAYLGCDRRTCLRWEKKLGLPVHRIEGGAKSSVFADKEELDRWLMERSARDGAGRSGPGLIPITRKKSIFSFRRWTLSKLTLFHLGVWAVIIIIFFALTNKPGGQTPHDFKIDGSVLSVINGSGKTLWRFDTGLKNLVGDAAYHSRFQHKNRSEDENALFPQIAFEDLNGDGKKECLFSTQTNDEFREGELFCLDHKGRRLWRFKSGRALTFGSQLYASDYRILGFEVVDFDKDDNLEIAVISYHKPDWPSQLVVLEADGRTRGEFWNSGQMSDLAFVDLNGDGREELVTCGVNNEYGKGFVAVFNPAVINGCSPQIDERYRCQDLNPGSEKLYILLPRTEIDLAEHPVESASACFVLESRELSFRMFLSGLYYEFDFPFFAKRVRPSHQFELKYMRAAQEGKVHGPLNEAYYRNLMTGILYWDGETKVWSLRHAMSNKW